MKDFFAEIIELLTICVLVICFAFASFLFISNFYHYKEISSSQTINMKEDGKYKEYKATLARVDKKMKSVNYERSEYGSTAKPIFDYYSMCIKDLKEGTFAKLENQSFINAKDIYDANNEIINTYNNKCIFYIPYNITVIGKTNNFNHSFKNVFKKTEEKRNIVLDNADYLTKSGLGNSSYGFTTETSRNSIYSKTTNELKLTMNNYNMMASILENVANWYVAEFGGNS